MNKRNFFKITHILTFVSTLFLFCTISQAQERSVNGWLSYIEIGPSLLQHEEVNIALDSQGYGPLAKTYFSLGAGFDGVQNRWIVGGKLYGFMLDSSFVSGNEAYLHYYYGNLRLGYLLSRPGVPTLLYPTVGFGWGAAQLRVKPISQPVSEKHWAAGGIMDIALNLQHLTAFEETDDHHGFSLGFSVGYIHDFNKGWRAKNFVPDQVISYSPRGLYVRISLGVGKLSSLGVKDD